MHFGRFFALAAVALSGAMATLRKTEDVDVLLRGGTIIDGTGSAAHVADVAIRGDRIVFIGDAAMAALTPKRTIDVRGSGRAASADDERSQMARGLVGW